MKINTGKLSQTLRIEKVMEVTRSLVHFKSHVSEIKWSTTGLWSPCWRTHDLALFPEILVTLSLSSTPTASQSPSGHFTSFHSLNLHISPCGASSKQVLHQQGGWWASSLRSHCIDPSGQVLHFKASSPYALFIWTSPLAFTCVSLSFWHLETRHWCRMTFIVLTVWV